jgi:SpoVK/Ycf46/Vps4 family AAA+-type ATPase
MVCHYEKQFSIGPSKSSHVRHVVIRPHLPLDILQDSVGETEDVLLSLGEAIRSRNERVVVIIDDVDHVLASGGDLQTHQMTRCQSALLSFLDSIRVSVTPTSNILLVFTTSRSELGVELSRFDRTDYLETPSDQERVDLIANLLRLKDGVGNSTLEQLDGVGALWTSVIESTVGRSYSEVVQYCRQAIERTALQQACDDSDKCAISILSFLKDRLQAITPESLRSGVYDDYVDMRILTAKELVSSPLEQNEISSYELPMKGLSAAKAWNDLHKSIIIPLCRSKELYALLDQGSLGTRKCVVGAILLTGESGAGKTEIALHCARHAAKLLSSVKLIDVSCNSLIHKEVGSSERAVHRLFEAARKAAPCILLLDGVESIAAVRGNDVTSEGTMDRLLSTLLVELDGIDEGSTSHFGGVAVIAISQNARWIDPALRRPGRLDRAVQLTRDWV